MFVKPVMNGVTKNISYQQNYDTIRYDTRCYFNVRSIADISQLNLPHGKTGTNINSLFSVDLQSGIYADKTAIEQTFTS